MRDLLERDPLTFVRATTRERLEWERTLTQNEPYSKYVLGDIAFGGKLHVLAVGYKLAASLISTITEKKVTLRVDPTENFATSTALVCISTQVIEEEEFTPFEQIDVLLGEGTHEGAHIAFTDFDLLSFPSTPEGKIKHTICNIIEDERIEILTCERYPGYSRFLEKVKYYFFDFLYQNELPDYKAMRESEKLFSLFFSMVRYPKYIREQDLDLFAGQVEQIREVLTPYPLTCEEIKIAVEKLYAILKADHLEKQKKKLPSHQTTFEKELGEMAETLNKILDSSLEEGSKKQIRMSDTLKADENISRLLEGIMDKGLGEDVYFIKAGQDLREYERCKKEVNAYCSTLSAILQRGYREGKVTTNHLRSGSLDTSRLVAGYLGADTIYQRSEEVKTSPLAVALLVDLSYSMYGKKMEEAQKCAILFNEALKKVKGISYFIYGHSADDTKEESTDIYVFREGNYKPAYALGTMEAKSSNRDGVAILETAKRIRKHTADPCLLFVISDGQPNASGYGGKNAITHTKESVKKAQKLGFQVVQIAIEPHVPSAEMFTNFVTLTRLSTLSTDLGKVLKKAIEKEGNV